MSGDSFEASLHRLFDEEDKDDQKVVTPTWEVAQIIRDPKLKLKVRNEPGSANPYSERNIDFIAGLGVENVLMKGILHLGETKALSSLSQNIRDLKAGFCAFLSAPITGTQGDRTVSGVPITRFGHDPTAGVL